MILTQVALPDDPLQAVKQFKEEGITHLVILDGELDRSLLATVGNFGVTFQHAPAGFITDMNMETLRRIANERPNVLIVGPTRQAHRMISQIVEP